MMGILQDKELTLPATVVVLSSHTKLISVDSGGKILGSLTTMSGQTFEAVKNNTFLTKSLEDDGSGAPEDYFDEAVVENAAAWIRRAGLVRSFMFPRFLDVLLDTKWYVRLREAAAVRACRPERTVQALCVYSAEGVRGHRGVCHLG